MEVIELKTLVDITNTNVRRPTQGTERRTQSIQKLDHSQSMHWYAKHYNV